MSEGQIVVFLYRQDFRNDWIRRAVKIYSLRGLTLPRLSKIFPPRKPVRDYFTNSLKGSRSNMELIRESNHYVSVIRLIIKEDRMLA